MTIAVSVFSTVVVTDNGATTGTTSSLNTTGCTGLIAACVQKAGTLPVSVSDSKSNTWVRAGASVPNLAGTPGTLEVFYCKNPTVGTGHTVTFANSAGSSRWTGTLLGCTGSDQSAFFDNWDGGKAAASAVPFVSNSYSPSSFTNGVVLLELCTTDASTETSWTENNGATIAVSTIFGAGFPHSVQAAIAFRVVTSGTSFTASFTDGSASTSDYAAAIYGFLGTAGGVTVGLTGQSATFSAGTLTQTGGFSVPVSTSVVSGPGNPSLSSPTNNLQFARLRGLTQSSANVSVALSGQLSTFSAGSLLGSLSIPLTGQSATFSAGTLSASSGSNVTAALTGSIATFASGLMNPAMLAALTGQSATFSAGTLANGGLSVSLIGQAATFHAGTMIPSGGNTPGGGPQVTIVGFVANVGSLMSH